MAGDRILDGLNDAQREAVTHDAGPLLIVAGAGTGKTTVITRRIAWLIAQRRARPEEILALTFTDKAAAEMEERVDQLVPYGYADVEIATFHAFGDSLLRGHSLEIGLKNDFSVLSRAEQVIFLRDRLFELPLARYRPLGDPTRHLQAIITLVSRCKDENISPEDYAQCAERLRAAAEATPDDTDGRDRAEGQVRARRDLREVPGADGARRATSTSATRSSWPCALLRERPHVLNLYQRRFKYILVDEFQDTNYAQFELVKRLGARHHNVAVVADDDQAIYRWRGAAISNVLGLSRPLRRDPAGRPHRELPLAPGRARRRVPAHRLQQSRPAGSPQRDREAPDRRPRGAGTGAHHAALRDRHPGGRRRGADDSRARRGGRVAVLGRGGAGALERRRGSVPALVQPARHPVDLLGQCRALWPARGASAARLSAGGRPSRRLGERPLPGLVGSVPGAHRRSHPLRDPRRPQAPLALRRPADDGREPRAGRRDLDRGLAGDSPAGRRPRPLHGARPRDADRRAALPVPGRLRMAGPHVQGGHRARRGRGPEHLQVLPPHSRRQQGVEVRQRARVREAPGRPHRRRRRPGGGRGRRGDAGGARAHGPQGARGSSSPWCSWSAWCRASSRRTGGAMRWSCRSSCCATRCRRATSTRRRSGGSSTSG